MKWVIVAVPSFYLVSNTPRADRVSFLLWHPMENFGHLSLSLFRFSLFFCFILARKESASGSDRRHVKRSAGVAGRSRPPTQNKCRSSFLLLLLLLLGDFFLFFFKNQRVSGSCGRASWWRPLSSAKLATSTKDKKKLGWKLGKTHLPSNDFAGHLKDWSIKNSVKLGKSDQRSNESSGPVEWHQIPIKTLIDFENRSDWSIKNSVKLAKNRDQRWKFFEFVSNLQKKPSKTR